MPRSLSPLLVNVTEHLRCLQTPEACRGAFPIYFSLLIFIQSMSFFLSELIFNVFFWMAPPYELPLLHSVAKGPLLEVAEQAEGLWQSTGTGGAG